MTILHLIGVLVVGFLVGLIGRFLHPGDDKMGIFLTIGLGIAGSAVASYGGQILGFYKPGEPAGFIGAVVGAIVVLVVFGMVRKATK